MKRPPQPPKIPHRIGLDEKRRWQILNYENNYERE